MQHLQSDFIGWTILLSRVRQQYYSSPSKIKSTGINRFRHTEMLPTR